MKRKQKTKNTETTSYRDEEMIEACGANENTTYYKCKMLNNGWCFKCYKPSVAQVMLQRGAYRKILPVT